MVLWSWLMKLLLQAWQTGLLSFEDLITELQQTGKPEALGAYAVNDEVVAGFTDGVTAALRVTNAEKESEDMNKELVEKMLAGLSDAEKAEVIASLNGTETTAVATPGCYSNLFSLQATVPVAPAVAVQVRSCCCCCSTCASSLLHRAWT
jgi:hypothetical protein